MWIRPSFFSTMKIKGHLVTLEHIIIEWLLKWIVYKILDYTLRITKKKFQGGLTFGQACAKISISFWIAPYYLIIGYSMLRGIRVPPFLQPMFLFLPLFPFSKVYRYNILRIGINLLATSSLQKRFRHTIPDTNG